MKNNHHNKEFKYKAESERYRAFLGGRPFWRWYKVVDLKMKGYNRQLCMKLLKYVVGKS